MAIARALVLQPSVLLCDESVSMLDAEVQAEVLLLLRQLQQELGVAILFVTHDLGVVAGMSDQVMVMYAGRQVEQGSCDDIFYRSHHPYTNGLLKSVPLIDHDQGELYSIPGLPPDPSRLPSGCAFAPRCERVMESCQRDAPLPIQQISAQHNARCYLEVSS